MAGENRTGRVQTFRLRGLWDRGQRGSEGGPRADRSCTVLTRWPRVRPRRSSFQTTSMSPVRSARTQLSSPERSRLACVVNGRWTKPLRGR